jgi:ABC-type Zn uptake system ZnuABC Zn-binding protein ZnuA
MLFLGACGQAPSRNRSTGILPVHKGPIKVVTTLGVLADWTRQVGGDRVQVTSLLTGLESPHTYEARPADIRKLADADILFRVGLGLEEWLGGPIENSGNRRLRIVEAATGVDPIAGNPDEHEVGNPHVWLDPQIVKTAIVALVAELVRLDPKGESLYRARQHAYAARLDSLTVEIRTLFAPLSDRRLITFHDAWPYFARRFGLDIVASIEPIPGKEPSAKQIAELSDLIRREKVKVICSEPQLPSDLPNMLASETGIKVLVLSPLEGGVRGTGDYISMMRYNAQAIANALK